MVRASALEVGDMVNLENDSVFDPNCEFQFCSHKTQNAELSEVVEDIPSSGQIRMTFVNGNGEVFSEVVSVNHEFADPE